jgi:hypothetical protein
VSDPHPDLILKSFPHTRYYPEWRLITWHPHGVLNDTLADQIVEFTEMEELNQEVPFHRYTDLSQLTHIHLSAGYVFRMAQRRQQACEPVKSAFWADKVVTLSFAHVYEALMVGATIKVRVFGKRENAAEWLGVPAQILYEPEEPWQMPADK